MHAAVTGAAGFAGRHLLDLLTGLGHETTAVVRRPVPESTAARQLVADLADPEATAAVFRESRPEVIFHLAGVQTSVGRSWDEPGSTIAGNVATTINVLEAARRLDAAPRVVVVSSAEVFGTPAETELPLGDDAPLRPESPYGQSKAIVESTARFYVDHLSVDAVVARPFNHIGPGQGHPFVVPSLAAQIAESERAGGGTIRVGNVTARRDFSDVRDVVRAYLTIAEGARPGEVVNVASGRAFSVGELLARLLGFAEVDLEVVEDPSLKRPRDAALVVGDAARARALGWEPTIGIDQTLQDVLTEARHAAPV